MTATTTPVFGLREHALDALNRERTRLRDQKARDDTARMTTLTTTLRSRLLRLFNVDGVPLTPEEEAHFTPEWFGINLLDPGVHAVETLFAHVNGSTPVVIIEGIMIGPSPTALVVGLWNDSGTPDYLQPFSTITELGYWCENRVNDEADLAQEV